MKTSEHIDLLNVNIEKLVMYMLLKIKECDWHGVADAAMDIRELEAKKKVYQSLKD